MTTDTEFTPDIKLHDAPGYVKRNNVILNVDPGSLNMYKKQKEHYRNIDRMKNLLPVLEETVKRLEERVAALEEQAEKYRAIIDDGITDVTK